MQPRIVVAWSRCCVPVPAPLARQGCRAIMGRTGALERLGCLSSHVVQQPQPVVAAAAASSGRRAADATKTIWFVRHGESETNVSEDWTHRDPDLTARGVQQAEAVPADPILAGALAPGPYAHCHIASVCGGVSRWGEGGAARVPVTESPRPPSCPADR